MHVDITYLFTHSTEPLGQYSKAEVGHFSQAPKTNRNYPGFRASVPPFGERARANGPGLLRTKPVLYAHSDAAHALYR